MNTYTVNSSEHYGWFTGVSSNNQQVLVADNLNLFFSSEGEFIKIEEFEEYDSWEKRVEELIANQTSIRVNPFSVSESIGLSKYPSDYQDYLDNPNSFTSEEQSEYDKLIAEWDCDDCFVFILGDDFWLDSTGEVVGH